MSTRAIELHVWSPAFGLPSFDPECLAAIAYLNVALPKQYWVVVESNNASISPNGALPALKDNGNWVAGFDRIVAHIRQKSNGNAGLDKDLKDRSKALSTALSALISYHAVPILALSLYVSPQNWTNVVRPMYGNFLPWLLQYYIPGEHHKLALQRTSHFEWVTSTFGYDDQGPPPVSTVFANLTVPPMISGSDEREGVKEKITTRIRLERLVRDFLEVMDNQLASRDYLLGNNGPTSVDCYLIGYLSLFVYPKLPYPWLSEITRKDFPRVCEYVDRMRASAFPRNEELPWKKADPEDALSRVSWVVDSVKGYVGGGSRGQQANNEPNSSKLWPLLQAVSGIVAISGLAFLATREGSPLDAAIHPDKDEQPESSRPGEVEYDLSANSFLGIRR